MVDGIMLLVGLPGCGKSWLARDIASRDPAVHVVDDPRSPADLEGWTSRKVIVCDPLLCDPEIRAAAAERMAELYPDARIEWRYFAASPEICRRNLEFRDDGRDVIPTLECLAAIYEPPVGAEVIQVVDAAATSRSRCTPV
jgi:hypothetical protein